MEKTNTVLLVSCITLYLLGIVLYWIMGPDKKHKMGIIFWPLYVLLFVIFTAFEIIFSTIFFYPKETVQDFLKKVFAKKQNPA